MISRAFLDLDGTVYLSGKIIDGVDAEIRTLSDQGVRFHYMTNNTSYSSDEYRTKLQKLNLPLHDDAIISPTIVLSDWLRDQGIDSVFSVGTVAFRDELLQRGGARQDDQDPACVIVAFDRELDYDKLVVACGLINRGVPYYLTHIDLACPSDVGPIPDCGAIGRLVQATTGVEATGHFGKPGDLMLGYLQKLAQPGEAVMVAGDRDYTDAEIGLRLGAHTVLVCSGEYKRETKAVDSRIDVRDTLADYLRSLRA